MLGTYTRLDSDNRSIETSILPILSLKKGETISFRSNLIVDDNSYGLKEGCNVFSQEIERKNCVAVIKTEHEGEYKYFHSFTVTGTDTSEVNEMIQELSLRVFNQSDDVKPLFTKTKSFFKRFRYLLKWLFAGSK